MHAHEHLQLDKFSADVMDSNVVSALVVDLIAVCKLVHEMSCERIDHGNKRVIKWCSKKTKTVEQRQHQLCHAVVVREYQSGSLRILLCIVSSSKQATSHKFLAKTRCIDVGEILQSYGCWKSTKSWGMPVEGFRNQWPPIKCQACRKEEGT